MNKEISYHCCICDERVYENASHKCPEKILKAINSAHSRGDNWEPPDNRTVGDRIREGNEILRMAGDHDGD